MSGKEEISLYFHIPFCTKKCPYCHFYVVLDKESLKDRLLEALLKEISFWDSEIRCKNVCSVYFGGGTPSLFGPQRIKKILNSIPFSSSQEITLEVNPEETTFSLMQEYHEVGVNRISLGIQSLCDSQLKLLGRLHSAKKAIESVFLAEKAGFENISVDLMYDLPHQTFDSWKTTLEQITKLPITHLSLYNLTIEPHTAFFKNQALIKKQLPDERISTEMYMEARKILSNCGLEPYEISAFSKKNYQSIHNSGYWKKRAFLGFGPSAFSFWEGKRFRNWANLLKYCSLIEEGKTAVDFEEQLEPEAQKRELFVLQLRLREGVDYAELESLDNETKKIFCDLEKAGFIEVKNEKIYLTHKGILFYDTVAAELI